MLPFVLTVVATWAILPMSRWPDTMGEIVTSALNVQNWALAIRAAGYTAATAAASPVQHFWSLSVEEQFYLVIPVLLLLARRFRPGRVRLTVEVRGEVKENVDGDDFAALRREHPRPFYKYLFPVLRELGAEGA